MRRQDVPLQGDLEIHLVLEDGDLATEGFDVSGSSVRLDDIAKMESSTKKQERLDPWFCNLEIEKGLATIGTPMTLDSRVRLTMHDTRPVLYLLRKFTNQMKWLSLTRNAKGIDGTMDLGFGDGFVAVNDLSLTGENVEILGWVHIREQQKFGRIFARHGARSAAMAFDGDRSRVVTIRPRKWFENQKPQPPPN